MDWTQVAFKSIGGLGLFLMGMKIMSEGMQKTTGDRLRKTLNFLTSNRFLAIFVGFLVTGVIQSSSATTVMVVGFVNATLLSLEQAIGVILGANIGTTVTGWIVTLKIVKYSLPLIGLGVFIRFFSKSEKWRYWGEVIFGFGILFLGMETMKAGFAPLREQPEFIAFFTRVNGSGYLTILLGVLVGTITTVAVQSSSATIGITIALASQGLLNFDGAVSLILGDNIGTTITANLASIGGNYHAKRAAIAHTLFNMLGVIVILAFFSPFVAAIERIAPGVSDFTVKTADQAAQFGTAIGTKPFIGRHIAVAHTLFNVSNVIIFAMLVPLLAKVCRKIIPEPRVPGEQRVTEFTHIDSSLIETPALGIAESEKKLIVMAEKVAKSALVVTDMISNGGSTQRVLCDKVLESEKVIDEYQKNITAFLVTLSSGALSERDANRIGHYMTLSHNLEKYADHLEHIALILDKTDRNQVTITDDARENLMEIFKENTNFFSASFNALTENVEPATFMERAQVMNRRVKKLVKSAKFDHFARIRSKQCKNEAAIYFMDLLNYLDGMRSQSYNIAEVTTGTKYKTD